jgi:hypothetical protein
MLPVSVYFSNCHCTNTIVHVALTTHQVNPAAHAHLLRALHHLQGLIQQNLPGQCIVNNLNKPVCQRIPPPVRVLLHRNPPSERQLNNNAPTQRITDIVIPEAQVPLLVLEAHEQAFLHERELGLL